MNKYPLRLIGDVFKNSEWSQVLAHADNFTLGVADNLHSASHIRETRRAHEITFLTLCGRQVSDEERIHLLRNLKTIVQNNLRPLCVQDFLEMKNLERLLTNQH